MEKAFEKLGIYDFIGIWGAGALTVTYYMLSFPFIISQLFKSYSDCSFNFSNSHILILMYTAIAYLTGVILQELGKIIVDLGPWLNADNLFNRQKEEKKLVWRIGFHPFRKIRLDSIKTLNTNKIKEFNFEKAISHLKYEEVSTRKIDSYHSAYALARSLFLSFSLHIMCSLIVYLKFRFISFYRLLMYLLIDTVLAVLFCIRTCRYFYSWVKNVLVQYHIVVERCKR